MATLDKDFSNTSIGTPLSPSSTKIMLLGAGELGKELLIELQRFGVETIAVDRYRNAPAMQVAHRSYVINMMDGAALRDLVEQENPTYIVPEIEALATDTLFDLEQEGYTVIPTARATQLTMDREGIRKLSSQDLDIPTSAYKIARTKNEYLDAIKAIGIPCVIKPLMSSSGKGQTIVHEKKDIEEAWEYAQSGARGITRGVIVEEFVPFDYEITLLTIRTTNQTLFCEPIGHRQVNGDYRESWQPHPMKEETIKHAQEIAKKITDSLGGRGVFGVEFFIVGEKILFSEVSPRPHDTGLVTLISQDLSEFALHARAILGLPIPQIRQTGPAASHALLVQGISSNVRFSNLDQALADFDTHVRLFGKPEVKGERRMGVVVTRDNSVDNARKKAQKVINTIQVSL